MIVNTARNFDEYTVAMRRIMFPMNPTAGRVYVMLLQGLAEIILNNPISDEFAYAKSIGAIALIDSFDYMEPWSLRIINIAIKNALEV